MVSNIRQTSPSSALLSRAEMIAEYVVFELEQVTLDLGPGGLAEFQTCDADAIVRVLGYQPRGGVWRELDGFQAREFIAYNAGHDLAYPNPAVRPPAECESLCLDLLVLIGEPARCFARHSKQTPEQTSYSNAPLRTDWTFSESYLFVAEEVATLCTFLAED